MSISRKLILLAFISTMALIVVGANGYYSSSMATSTVELLNTKTLPGIEILYGLKSDQQQLAISIYKHSLAESEAEKRADEKEFETLSANLRNGLDLYKPLLRSAEGKELHQQESARLEEYLSFLARYLERSKSGDRAGATAYVVPMGGKRAELAQLVDRHIELNAKNAREEAAEEARRVLSADRIAVAVILLAVAAIVGASILIIKGIHRSVVEIQRKALHIESNLDLTTRVNAYGDDELAHVAAAINGLLEKLRSSFAEVAEGADRIAASSTQVASAAGEVAIAATHQSDAASNMAASVEQMTVSIAHVRDRSGEANTLSRESGRLASDGIHVIGETVEDIDAISQSVHSVSTRIGELERHSANISSVVSVIKEVAEQTNLLALNAAIEAARAGEQGRGFAVVADEVRKLAERTAGSTQEISLMIEAMKSVSKDAVDSIDQAVRLVEDGVQRAGRATESIQAIGERSFQAVGMVDEIASAIREQSQASNSIATNVERIAQMAEESSASAQNSAEAARGMDELVTSMRRAIAGYKL